MQCVILAGGLGSRLGDLTVETPKPLLEIEGHPFLFYQLLDLSYQGVKDIVLSIGYRGDQIRQYVGDGHKWGINVRYVDEGRDLKGTAGALRLILDSTPMGPAFLVVYGDSYLIIDYLKAWNSFNPAKSQMLMAVLKNDGLWDQSNCVVHDDRVTLYDKWVQPKPSDMVYIDYGLAIFQQKVILDSVAKGQKMDLALIAHTLSLQNQVQAFLVQNRFYEIGSLAGLSDFRDLIRSGYFTHKKRVFGF